MSEHRVTLTAHEVAAIRREVAELIAALERIDTRLRHAEQEANNARNGNHRRPE